LVDKISPADHDSIAAFVIEEKDRRANSQERKQKEDIWAEVDRQVSMQAPDGAGKEDWQSNIEPGMLADALETFSDDILRIAMPSDRHWFSPKVELPIDLAAAVEGNDEKEDAVQQKKRSNTLKCLMSQQHLDTGLREAVKLSVKEAYKHGSFCAEVRFKQFPKWHKGGKQEAMGSPIWIPHSMWNCYPAQEGTTQVSALSYQGSMIIKCDSTWQEVSRDKRLFNVAKLKPKVDVSKPVTIFKYFGDVFIPKTKTDIYLPNMEVWVIEDVLVFGQTNELPYSPIIFGMIEKDDVNDDYASS